MPSIAALRRILLPGDIGDMGDEGDEGVGPLALELGSRSSALGEGTRPGMRPGEIGETETLRSTCWAFIARRLRKGFGEIGEVGMPHLCKAANGDDMDCWNRSWMGTGSSKASPELALGIAMSRGPSPKHLFRQNDARRREHQHQAGSLPSS